MWRERVCVCCFGVCVSFKEEVVCFFFSFLGEGRWCVFWVEWERGGEGVICSCVCFFLGEWCVFFLVRGGWCVCGVSFGRDEGGGGCVFLGGMREEGVVFFFWEEEGEGVSFLGKVVFLGEGGGRRGLLLWGRGEVVIGHVDVLCSALSLVESRQIADSSCIEFQFVGKCFQSSYVAGGVMIVPVNRVVMAVLD